MSSRFRHRTCGARAGRDLVESSSGKRSVLLMEMAAWREGSDGTLPRHVAGEHVTRQLVRRVKHGGAPNGCNEDAKGELGLDHYEGRSFRGWNHHVSMVLVCSRLSPPERSRLFPPCRKTATRKSVAFVTTGGRQPARSGTSGIPSSLCAWPSRASGHMVYPMPPVVTDRDRWDRWCTCP